MIKSTKIKIIITLFILNFFIICNIIFAQSPISGTKEIKYNLLSAEKKDGGFDDGFDYNNSSFFRAGVSNPFIIKENEDQAGGLNFLNYLVDLTIGISIATAVILFMTGALSRLFNDKAVKSIKSGKETMKNSVIGLILVLTMYLILQTINPDLVRIPVLNPQTFK